MSSQAGSMDIRDYPVEGKELKNQGYGAKMGAE